MLVFFVDLPPQKKWQENASVERFFDSHILKMVVILSDLP